MVVMIMMGDFGGNRGDCNCDDFGSSDCDSDWDDSGDDVVVVELTVIEVVLTVIMVMMEVDLMV